MNKYLIIPFLLFLFTGCATTNPRPNIIGENPIVSEKASLNQSERYFAQYYQKQKGINEVPDVAQISGETPIETETNPEPEETAPPVIEATAKKRPDISESSQEEISKIKKRLDGHDKEIGSLKKSVSNLEAIQKKLDAKLATDFWDGKSDPKVYRIGSFGVGKSTLDEVMKIQVASAIKSYNNISAELEKVGKKLYFEIRGYADETENPSEAEIKNNIEISEKRAETVKQALQKGGIKGEVITTKAMGGYTEYFWKSNNRCVRIFAKILP